MTVKSCPFSVNTYAENSSSALIQPVEPEPLEDIKINAPSGKNGSNEKSESIKDSNNSGIYEASSFPFVPRQILEVVPQKVSGAEGIIKVKVLIGLNGYVKQHKILNNTTNSETELKFVVDAVYKSRWQSITIEGQKVEYWIEKTYAFN